MQKPFTTLSQRGQAHRITTLARKVLEAYAVFGGKEGLILDYNLLYQPREGGRPCERITCR